MKKMMKIYAAALAAILMVAMLAGCAKDYADAAPTASHPVTTEPAATQSIDENDTPMSNTPEPTEDVDSTDTVEDNKFPAILQWYLDYKCDAKMRALKEKEWGAHTQDELEVFAEKLEKLYGDEYHAYLNGKDYVAPEADSEPDAPEFGSVEAIAALGGKEATVQKDKDECLVYIFDETKNHGNPYDVTWDYGKDYDSYVEAADWSLVFDAEYYKATFPMLAMLYHNDDALLLKHFQTVGIHEGRQASEKFNVAAYMGNCDKALRDAFGDNYECYYLYYLLHQDTESGVKTTGSYKSSLRRNSRSSKRGNSKTSTGTVQKPVPRKSNLTPSSQPSQITGPTWTAPKVGTITTACII